MKLYLQNSWSDGVGQMELASHCSKECPGAEREYPRRDKNRRGSPSKELRPNWRRYGGSRPEGREFDGFPRPEFPTDARQAVNNPLIRRHTVGQPATPILSIFTRKSPASLSWGISWGWGSLRDRIRHSDLTCFITFSPTSPLPRHPINRHS